MTDFKGFKRVTQIKAVKKASSPDIDSDFSEFSRDQTLEYIKDKYGADKVSNIITFNTLASRASFKQLCTIYEIPFALANKVSALIPGAIDGKAPTLKAIFDPKSVFYYAGADFRNAVDNDTFRELVKSAIELENRVKSTGVHPCGVIISGEPLSDHIPLTVRQKDGTVLAGWEYPQLEAIGNLKFDFLVVETPEIIQQTLKNVIRAGKTPPNMVEIIQGEMDDEKTMKMLGEGKSVGVFQFASPGIQELLKTIENPVFDDLVAINAIYRPGPMEMGSHTKYVNRRKGIDPDIRPIHPDFVGGPLDEILAKTQGLLVYQEQVQQIANEIAGMTLQQGDDLRKAMGKKKVSIMAQMKPVFIKGGKDKHGYSEEAMNALWNTMEPFAKYAFNKSHSVAYAMNAYSTAFLKANFPAEFMSALISLSLDDKDKISNFILEARRMGLKVASVDINRSDVNVSPDLTDESKKTIIFGFAGVDAVSPEMAQKIVDARGSGFTSVGDVFEKCVRNGVTNRRVFENLASVGAFDCFGVSRKQLAENVDTLISRAIAVKDDSGMVGLFGAMSLQTDDLGLNGTDYSYIDKISLEAQKIGLFISGHPLANLGREANLLRTHTISDIRAGKYQTNTPIRLVATPLEILSKTTRAGNKRILVNLDDATGSMRASLSKQLVASVDRAVALKQVENAYIQRKTNISDELLKLAEMVRILPVEPLQVNQPYVFECELYHWGDSKEPQMTIRRFYPIHTDDNGAISTMLAIDPKPQFVRNAKDKITTLRKDHGGDREILVAKKDTALLDSYHADNRYLLAVEQIRADKQGLAVLEETAENSESAKNAESSENAENSEVAKNAENTNNAKNSNADFSAPGQGKVAVSTLFGGTVKNAKTKPKRGRRAGSARNEDLRQFPPRSVEPLDSSQKPTDEEYRIALALDNLHWRALGSYEGLSKGTEKLIQESVKDGDYAFGTFFAQS